MKYVKLIKSLSNQFNVGQIKFLANPIKLGKV